MSKPKLRFPEFAGDWVQHILSDVIVDIADGPFGSNLKLEHYTDKKEARIIQLSNLSDYGWQEENTRYTTFEHAEAIKRCIVNEDELIMGKMMPAGMTIMRPTTDKMYVLSSDCVRIKLDKSTVTDGFFLYTTKSEEFLNQIRSSSQGSTRIRTSISKIKNMNLNIPSLPEQQKIASLFTELDNLIQSAEKELEGYRELKQGMLQKMFPKKGEKVPEIRFPEFTNDWEQRKVTELLKNSSSAMKIGPFGSALKKEYFVEEGVKVYAQENAFTGDFSIGDYYITEDKYKELKSCELYPGDLVISMMGTIGACAIFPKNAEKGIMNSHLLRLQFNNEVIPEYIMYLLRDSVLIRKQIDRLSVGSIMSGLSSSVVKKLVFPIPKLAEQKRIAGYFENLDNLIASQQQELDGYKELKKGLLQQMFC